MLLEGVYRRFQSLLAGKGPIDLRMTGQESMAVAQVEPSGAEMTRAGKRFLLGNSAAITGIAPVQALPTTTLQWTLWNTSPEKTLFFETIGMYLTSGTPGVGGILLAALVRAPAQVGVSVTGAKVSSAADANNSNSGLIVKTGVTATDPAAPNWFPIASNPSPNVTAFAGSTYLENRNIAGRIAVRPMQGLALNVIAPAGTTPLFAPFAEWCEYGSDME